MEVHIDTPDTLSVSQSGVQFIKPEDIQATFGSDSIGAPVHVLAWRAHLN